MGGFAEMYSQEKGRGLQKVSLALGGEQKWDDTSGGGGLGEPLPGPGTRVGWQRGAVTECGGEMGL